MKLRLLRRGIDHGRVAPAPRETAWAAGEPEVLRRAVRPTAAVRPALRLIGWVRRGRDLVHIRPAPAGFRYACVSQNTGDPVELHKLHVFSGRSPRELYVKANWLSTYPGDGSLRLRFSFGREILDDWIDDPVAGAESLRLCEGIVPASKIVTRDRGLAARLRRITGFPIRFLQPIVYSNAPNGGALFHHDRVPGQAGVLYTQLAGRTAWLTLPQRELARRVRARGLRLSDPPSDRVDRLINRSPAFTRELAEAGWLFALEPGDAILLPCEPPPSVAWHSVFTLGREPNLALSMGFSRVPRK